MPLTLQTLLVAIAVVGAAVYVVRSFLPRKTAAVGCGGCPSNPNRRDDYA